MMLTKFHGLRARMSIKIHYFFDKFPENVGDVSEEQGKRFSQNIKLR